MILITRDLFRIDLLFYLLDIFIPRYIDFETFSHDRTQEQGACVPLILQPKLAVSRLFC